MEAIVAPGTNYLNIKSITEKMQGKIFDKMKDVNEFHKLHNYDEVLSVKEEPSDRTVDDFFRDFVQYLIYSMECDPSAWAFLQPVKEEDAPGYYSVITNPMDLSKFFKKHQNNEYKNLDQFIKDVTLMTDNCIYFNGKDSQYSQWATNVMNTLHRILNKFSPTLKLWKLEYNRI